jgi:hypothetical protein
VRDRIKAAAADAVVFTVRWFVVVGLTAALGYGAVADYIRTREGANMGRAAVEYINKAIQAQQSAPPAPSK